MSYDKMPSCLLIVSSLHSDASQVCMRHAVNVIWPITNPVCEHFFSSVLKVPLHSFLGTASLICRTLSFLARNLETIKCLCSVMFIDNQHVCQWLQNNHTGVVTIHEITIQPCIQQELLLTTNNILAL